MYFKSKCNNPVQITQLIFINRTCPEYYNIQRI